MKRQFVNLVLGRCKDGTFTLNPTFTMHRIRTSSLFHPKKKQIMGRRPLLPPPTSLVKAELPKPACTVSLSTPMGDGGWTTFMPYGSSRDKILSVDHEGNVLVHDIGQNKLSSMPSLNVKGWIRDSVAITLGNALYLINRNPYKPNQFQRPYYDPCFQALIHGKPPANVVEFPGWHWHTLPLPPYVEVSGYEPRWESKIASSTVVGDSIWMSAGGGIGTYSFSTTSRTWSKVGSWELPFHDTAQYVPELDLWLGFSPEREENPLLLCASDLSAAAANGAAPTLCHHWKEDLATNLPESWVPLLSCNLVRVDSGRFCIARLFHGYDGYPFMTKENFAVFTGVELMRSDAADAGIQMVKHKSICYKFGQDGNLIHLIC